MLPLAGARLCSLSDSDEVFCGAVVDSRGGGPQLQFKDWVSSMYPHLLIVLLTRPTPVRRRQLSGRKPTKMWVDKGKEFYNKDVQGLVELYSTENEEKSSVVERWNRTMKEKMFKHFSANSTRVYISILGKLVEQYNNTKHSSIKMTPENKVWRNLYPDIEAQRLRDQPNFFG